MYEETKTGPYTAIRAACEARRGRGICGNNIFCMMNERDDVLQFILDMGWRLLRGHQVCPDCMKKKRIVFPRRAQQ